MSADDTGRLIAFGLILLGMVAAETLLLVLLMGMHRERFPAWLWDALDRAWDAIVRVVVPAVETALGAVLIALCFLSALTPAGRRRQAAAEAHIAAKRAEERDAFIHRNSRCDQGREGYRW